MNQPARLSPIAALTPQWPKPLTVRAAFTLRTGGVSALPFDTLNIAAHVGDEPQAVTENRRLLRAALSLPNEPIWLNQIHGVDVLDLDAATSATFDGAPRADAVFTRRAQQVCAIQVADCLPVLIADRDGSTVAAAHAGWRGLAAGVLEATIARLAIEPARLIAWLGPGIGQGHFEVGEDVRSAFLRRDCAAASAFTANSRGRWQCDLAALARARLAGLGVDQVFGGEWCTYADAARFYSHRRDGRCGRMAALIWRTE